MRERERERERDLVSVAVPELYSVRVVVSPVDSVAPGHHHAGPPVESDVSAGVLQPGLEHRGHGLPPAGGEN